MKMRDYARIVVEGMDGSGKSTLVKQLMEYLGEQGEYVPGYNRVVGDYKSPMPQWWMEQLSRNPVGKIVVHDRFFYPELVYGPVLRKRVVMDRGTESYVREFLRHRAFLIYCRPPVKTIMEGINKEEQMKGVKEHLSELLTSYDQVMIDEARVMNSRFAKYDWTQPMELVKLIRRLTGYIYE